MQLKESVDVAQKKTKNRKLDSIASDSIIQEMLKKPRTRSVSLTLSENGIDEDTEEVLPVIKKKKKSKDLCDNQAPEKKKKKLAKTKSEDIDAVSETKKQKKKEPKIKADSTEETEVPPEQKEGQFSKFPIRPATVKKLEAKGIKYLFPIQVKTFDKIYSGQDVIGKARTGTGKTLAFALPLIERIEKGTMDRSRGRPPKVLVLAPTRELAIQVGRDFKALSSLEVQTFYGGVAYGGQEQSMTRGLDILIGTPGRILDWVQKGKLNTSKLEFVVLDEVDQMLDMGFADDVDAIIQQAYNRGEGQKKPQTLLFSATLPAWVHKTAKKYMSDSVTTVDLVGTQVNQTATGVTHLAIRCQWKDQAAAIGKIVQHYSGDNGRAMIFCETKKYVDELAACNEIKQSKEKLHGDVKQFAREQVLKRFSDGTIKVLIATNVAARGLDIKGVDLVIQTDPPTDFESYVHRSGRTGRAGKTGVSILLYNQRSERDLINLERNAKIFFKRVNVPTTDDIVNTQMKTLLSSFNAIDERVVERFRTTAEEILSEKEPAEAVAALLAMVTGQTTVTNYSLQNSQQGFTTFIYKSEVEIKFKSYVYTMMSRLFPNDDCYTNIKGVNLLKDKMGAVFDVADGFLDKFQSVVVSNANSGVTKATSLPELDSQPASMNQSFSSSSRYNRGGFNKFNGNTGGGMKRQYGQNDWSSNKRIKFE